MNTQETHKPNKNNLTKARALNQDHGFFHSCTIFSSSAQVYEFCRKKENIMLVFRDLPEEIQKLLSLEVTSSSSQTVAITNSENSKLALTGTLTFAAAPADRGTVVTAEAFFEVPGSKLLSRLLDVENPEPSILVGIFLRRLKAQLETGEMATTKGQPSGREELTEKKLLH